MPAPSVPVDAQVKCVEREIRFRERVYANRVTRGLMTRQQADYEIEVMRAVLATLQRLATAERLI